MAASNSTQAPKPTPRATYKVIANLRHSNKNYRPGGEIELTKAEAAPLLRHKTVEPAK